MKAIIYQLFLIACAYVAILESFPQKAVTMNFKVPQKKKTNKEQKSNVQNSKQPKQQLKSRKNPKASKNYLKKKLRQPNEQTTEPLLKVNAKINKMILHSISGRIVQPPTAEEMEKMEKARQDQIAAAEKKRLSKGETQQVFWRLGQQPPPTQTSPPTTTSPPNTPKPSPVDLGILLNPPRPSPLPPQPVLPNVFRDPIDLPGGFQYINLPDGRTCISGRIGGVVSCAYGKLPIFPDQLR